MNPAFGPAGEVLILFTRFPEPGRTKTRLIGALGPEGAAALQREMTEHAVTEYQSALRTQARRFEVRFDGGSRAAMQNWLGRGPAYAPQGDGDLGQRLDRAATEAFQNGARAVVIVGADCPDLNGEIIESAFTALARSPVVLGPATDGGYYLVGLRRPIPQLFTGIPWGTGQVLSTSLKVARQLEVEPQLLAELTDVDEPDDLSVWERAREVHRSLSIIIPTFNEAEQLGPTIAAARAGRPVEIIVADGGSVDGTPDLARQLGASLVAGARGRARQSNAGAAAARGRTLLFLHADTTVPPDYADAIRRGLCSPRTVGGAFGFSVREPFTGRSLVEWATNLRSRWLQMPYGDQGLFVRRWAFDRVGGFPELPLMDDYEFVRRLRRLGDVTTLSEKVATSGRRWRRLGFWRTTLINKLAIIGYRLGVAPERLAALYRRSIR